MDEGMDTAGAVEGGEVSAEQGEQQEGQPQQDGQQDQGQQGPQGQQQGQFGDQGVQGGGAPRTVPYERFQETTKRASDLEAENRFWREQAQRQGGQPQQQGNWESQLPAEFKEAHAAIGGYMKHLLTPFAAHAKEMERAVEDLRDHISFYVSKSNSGYADDRMKIIEDTRQGLERTTGHPWSRQDVLRYLRGHEEHGPKFAAPPTQEQRGRALEQETVTARRGAGQVGGRQAAPTNRQSTTDPLAGKSRAERIKAMETDFADKPF